GPGLAAPSSHSTGRTHRIRRFLLTVQLLVALDQTDQAHRLEPCKRHPFRCRRTAAQAPPSLAAQGADPGTPRRHAQAVQEVGDGFGTLALLEAQAAELSADPLVQPL